MFGEELRSLLIQVITSWQVIVVTLAILLYVFLINYVSRNRYRRRPPPPPKTKEIKKSKKTEQEDEAVDDSELGLEE